MSWWIKAARDDQSNEQTFLGGTSSVCGMNAFPRTVGWALVTLRCLYRLIM